MSSYLQDYTIGVTIEDFHDGEDDRHEKDASVIELKKSENDANDQVSQWPDDVGDFGSWDSSIEAACIAAVALSSQNSFLLSQHRFSDDETVSTLKQSIRLC